MRRDFVKLPPQWEKYIIGTSLNMEVIKVIVLKNCRLIPYLTDGYSNPTADIFIDGKSIRGIYRCGTQSCEDAECYDLNGKTVLPGYFDLHAHLMFTNQNWEYLMHRIESAYVMDSAAYAKTYLKLGYTTSVMLEMTITHL